jgi:hypothetical protein
MTGWWFAMSRDVRQRIEDFETAIHSLVPASSTDEEVIAAGVSGTLTPPEAAQLGTFQR